MNRKKYTDEQFIDAVKKSVSKRELLGMLGLAQAGGNYTTINGLLEKFNIDTTHWLGHGHLKNKTHNWAKKIPLSEILVEHSSYVSSNKLRLRLLKEKYFDRVCYGCKNVEWLGKPIPIELEHINGIHNDNRIENLTLLCPNCHAQTPTYRGRNKSRSRNSRSS